MQQYLGVYAWRRRVSDCNSLSICKATHIAQTSAESLAKCLDLVDSVVQIAYIFSVSPDRIVNMDQTAIEFDPAPHKTIRKKDQKQ